MLHRGGGATSGRWCYIGAMVLHRGGGATLGDGAPHYGFSSELALSTPAPVTDISFSK